MMLDDRVNRLGLNPSTVRRPSCLAWLGCTERRGIEKYIMELMHINHGLDMPILEGTKDL